MPAPKDPYQYVGRMYGRLTVKAYAKRLPRIISSRQQGWNYYYTCICTCGKSKVIEIKDLVTRHTRSCGCLAKELIVKRSTKHGHAKKGQTSSEWRSWRAMFDRCYTPTASAYYKYGAKGVKVCDRWLEKQNGFINFLNDMGSKPTPRHTIDRIDGSKNYTPDNCRWATALEQANNQKSNVKVTWQGEVMNLSQLMRKLGVYTKSGVYYARLNRGWSVEKTFNTPV